jgi:hypothetical protein
LDELPFVDEHSLEIDAPPERVWDAAVAISRGAFGTSGGGLFARVVGCEDTEVQGEPGAEGSTIVGFHVETSRPPRELGLAGRHRFSEYRLTFLVDRLDDGCSRVRAQTHARFPGLHGRLYRAAVIGSGAHVRVTRRLLARIAERARRSGSAT